MCMRVCEQSLAVCQGWQPVGQADLEAGGAPGKAHGPPAPRPAQTTPGSQSQPWGAGALRADLGSSSCSIVTQTSLGFSLSFQLNPSLLSAEVGRNRASGTMGYVQPRKH